MTTSAEIETGRLLIRQFTTDDAEAFLPLLSLPDVLRYTGERPLGSANEVRELLNTRQLRDYAVHGYGRMACIEKETRRLIGFSGLKFLDDMDETDVGYRFLPECWGKGYATESAAAILCQQAAQFGLSRIIGLVEPENRGSVRVLQKLGLKFDGRGAGGDAALDRYTIYFAHMCTLDLSLSAPGTNR